MAEDLQEFIESVRRNKNLYAAGNEEATKQGVVLPLLARLGWNRDDISEVVPEYTVGTGRVDYCLKKRPAPVVFVEVKRLGEPLDVHQQQLLHYAFEQGVTIAALTDGVRWWLYLPTQPGSWEQRRFFTIDLEDQDPEDVAARLEQYLRKSAVFDVLLCAQRRTFTQAAPRNDGSVRQSRQHGVRFVSSPTPDSLS